MKRTFLSLSMLVAVASLMLGNTDAEARWRCCRGGYGYGYQNAYYGNGYQQAGNYQTTNASQTTTGTGCGVAANPSYAPATAPAPPQEAAPVPVDNQAPAAPAPGT